MDDFDHDYYRLIKEMLDYSIPNQIADKLISRGVLSEGLVGTLQTYDSGNRVGFGGYDAATVIESISPKEIAGVYDWPKMKQYLEIIALEQGMKDL